MDKALSFNNKLKWGLAVAAIPVLALLGYIAFHVILGLTVLYALVGSAAAAAVGYALLPAFSERLTQLKFGAFKATVAAFPIESLDGEVERGAKYLRRALDALNEKKASVEEFRMEVQKIMKDNPEDTEEAQGQLAMAEEEMAFHMQDYLDHEAKHDAFVKEVARQKRRWKLAQAGAKMRQALQIKDEFMSELRKNTAFEAIQKAHAESIGHMKLSRDLEYMRKRIAEAKEKPPALVFDITGHVVMPQTKTIDYAEALEGKAA